MKVPCYLLLEGKKLSLHELYTLKGIIIMKWQCLQSGRGSFVVWGKRVYVRCAALTFITWKSLGGKVWAIICRDVVREKQHATARSRLCTSNKVSLSLSLYYTYPMHTHVFALSRLAFSLSLSSGALRYVMINTPAAFARSSIYVLRV